MHIIVILFRQLLIVGLIKRINLSEYLECQLEQINKLIAYLRDFAMKDRIVFSVVKNLRER